MKLPVPHSKRAGKNLAILLAIVLGMGCAPKDRSDCKEKIKEIRTMIDSTIMDYGDYEVMLPPCTYCAGDFMRYIFAVPKDNMVGTNELDNAITLLEFKNDEELEKHVVKKDFMEMVTGPFEFRFLPAWSDKEIAYSQSKGFLLVNIPDKKVEIHDICPGLSNGDIENIAVFDHKRRTFVFEVLKSSGNQDGDIWDDKLLSSIRFENDSFTVLGEMPAGLKTSAYSEPWFVYDKKIFVYKDSITKLEGFDEQFKPVSHLLAEAFNQNQVAFRCLQEIAVHPTLPFSLVVERGKPPSKDKLKAADALPDSACEKAREVLYNEYYRLTLYLFRWTHPDPKQRFVPLVSVAGSIWNSYNPANKFSHFTFSPDGKWVVFRDGSMRGHDLNSSDNPIFVAVPIGANNPLYLGKPIKLGNALREKAIGPTGTAWTTNPTAFIMCDGLMLYRWNLAKYRSMEKVKMPPNTPDPFMKKD